MDKKDKKEENFSVSPGLWEPELIDYLYKKGQRQERNEFMRQAVSFYYEYCFYKKGFLVRLIQEDFGLSKHILRQVGNSIKIQNEKDKKFMSSVQVK